MEILNSFLGQGMVTQIGEIVLFANTVNDGNANTVAGKHDDGLHFKNTQQSHWVASSSC